MAPRLWYPTKFHEPKRRIILVESQLIDIRNCADESFKRIYKEMLKISLLQQPWWFRPVLKKSNYLQKLINYNHWSRAWEYPWAIIAAEMQKHSFKVLDVGGGGSPFAIYLAQNGHETYVIDPSLNQGLSSLVNKDKSIYRNMRSIIFHLLLKVFGIRRIWGLPAKDRINAIHYYPYSATDIKFSDNYFDRVFCLSVMEHIPVEIWEQCLREFERVLKPGGRIIITLDMGTRVANERIYLKLLKACKLQLIGNPDYDVPISLESKRIRHPGKIYETIGLVWQG